MPRFRVGDIVRLATAQNGSAAFARLSRGQPVRIARNDYSLCSLHANAHYTVRVQLWDPISGSVMLGYEELGGFCEEAFVYANGEQPPPPCQHITYPYCICGGNRAR